MEERPLLELLELADEAERIDAAYAEAKQEWTEKARRTLVSARESAGLSQATLASSARVPASYLNRVEHGKQSFTSEQLMKFHETLSVMSMTTNTGGTSADQGSQGQVTINGNAANTSGSEYQAQAEVALEQSEEEVHSR